MHPSLRNLAPDLEKQGYDLDGLASQIIEEYITNKESRSEWEDIHAKWVKLYHQQDKPINRDRWSGASDESIPLLTEATHAYHTRMYSAMFANRRLVTVRPTGRSAEEDMERAERLSLHMTWQMTVKDRDYKREKDRLLLGLPVHGQVFTKTYRDPWLGRNIVRNVRATDLMLPYGVGPRNLEDVESKTEVIWSTVNNTAIMASTGFFTTAAQPTSRVQDWLTAPDLTLEETVGHYEPQFNDDMNMPVLLLESHRLADFDGDGIAEPYIVTVDVESQKTLRVAIRWETDEAGNPIPGQWYNTKRPIEYYTSYPFYENPDGIYGLGLGHVLGEVNKAVNRLLRETVDAGMLANAGNMSGFINKGMVGVQGGPLEIELGKFKAVESGVDDINRGIYQFKFPGPNQALFNALQLLLMRGDRLGLNTEAVTGQLERALQPTTVLALLEESNRGFGSVNERVVHAWGEELMKVYRLNFLHMDPMEYFSVLDIDGSMVDQQVSRNDYAMDMEVVPTVDPQMKSEKERLQKAQLEYQTFVMDPLVNADPTGMSQYNLRKRFAQAMKLDRIDEILPNPMLLAMAGVNIPALFAGMQMTDETGLTDGQQNGNSGMVAGAGGGGGFPPLGGALSNGEMEDGSNLGGSAPGAGSEGGR